MKNLWKSVKPVFLKYRLYFILGGLLILIGSFTLYHFYDLGKSASEHKQAVAIQKVTVKNRKDDVKIDRKTPSSDKSVAIEWLLNTTRK